MLVRRRLLGLVQEGIVSGPSCVPILIGNLSWQTKISNIDQKMHQTIHTEPDGQDIIISSAKPFGEMDAGPVNFVVQAIDSVHATLGLPWWATIPLAAISVRTLMLPLTVQQIRSSASTFALLGEAVKVSQATEAKRGQGKVGQQKHAINRGEVISIFNQLRRATGSPHPMWVIASPLLQIPVFISSVVAVRRMSLSDWPGFSTEGVLWFPDLTQAAVDWSTMSAPLGVWGATLPFAISLSYLLIVEVAFKGGRIVMHTKNPVASAAVKVLHMVLQWVAIPIVLVAFQLPHGTLLYWLTNNLFSISSNLVFSHPSVRPHLQMASVKGMRVVPEPVQGHPTTNSVPSELAPLFMKAAQLRADKNFEASLAVLEEIANKNSGLSQVHYARGQLLSEMKEFGKAAESYTRAAESMGDIPEASPCWLGAGVSRIMEGELQMAEIALIKASELNKWDVTPLMALTSLYKKMGNSSKAREALAEAVKLKPELKKYKDL